MAKSKQKFLIAFALLIIALLAINALFLQNLMSAQQTPASGGSTGFLPNYGNNSNGGASGGTGLYDVRIIELVNSSCTICFNVSWVTKSLIDSSQQLGIKVLSVNSVDVNSSEGLTLAAKYNLTNIPTVIVQGEGYKAPKLVQAFQDYGNVEPDGALVLRTVYAPYWDMAAGRLRGNASVIYLYKANCPECFPASFYGEILTNLYGVQMFYEDFVDSDSERGAELRKNYSITWVPTVLVSPELKDYPDMEALWLDKFGSIEEDGNYLFRNTQVLNNKTYFDYSKNKTITTVPIIYDDEEISPTPEELG